MMYIKPDMARCHFALGVLHRALFTRYIPSSGTTGERVKPHVILDALNSEL
jgi:hypothetical protein